MKPKPKSKTKTAKPVVFPWERPKTNKSVITTGTVGKKVAGKKGERTGKSKGKAGETLAGKAKKKAPLKQKRVEFTPLKDAPVPYVPEPPVVVQEDDGKVSPFVKPPQPAPVPVAKPEPLIEVDAEAQMLRKGRQWIKDHPGQEVKVAFRSDDRDFLFTAIKLALVNGLVTADTAGQSLIAAMIEGLPEPRAVEVQEVFEQLLIKKLE